MRRQPRRRRMAAERAAARDRARARRERLETGRVVTRLEYVLDDLAVALVRLGYLREADIHDRDAVEAALQRHVAELAELSSHA